MASMSFWVILAIEFCLAGSGLAAAWVVGWVVDCVVAGRVVAAGFGATARAAGAKRRMIGRRRMLGSVDERWAEPTLRRLYIVVGGGVAGDRVNADAWQAGRLHHNIL